MSKKKKRVRIRKQNGEWKLCGHKNRHHNFARVRGGTMDPVNIFHWDINIHRAYHFIFGNKTLLEAAAWLKQVHDAKRHDVELDIQGGNDDTTMYCFNL